MKLFENTFLLTWAVKTRTLDYYKSKEPPIILLAGLILLLPCLVVDAFLLPIILLNNLLAILLYKDTRP